MVVLHKKELLRFVPSDLSTAVIGVNLLLCALSFSCSLTHTLTNTQLSGVFNPRRGQAQASGSSVKCLGTILLGVTLSLWHDDLAVWGWLHTNTQALCVSVCLY